MTNSINSKFFCLTALAITIALGPQLVAQVQTDVPAVIPGAKPVTVEHVKIHGTALEGNLEGDAVDRDVLVFLPPSYAQKKSQRFAVLYALHGYSIGAEQWSHEIHVPQTIEGAFAQGAKEMIVVLPDSKTLHNGSMYSSSVTTGDFEHFIAHDLVAYIDAHYRTIPNRLSRGLVGHSMGGYGATRIGMKHSDVFGSLYIMSPCCLSPRPTGPANPEIEKALEAVKTPEDSAKLSFFPRAQLATAAAWSPIRRIHRSISICRPRMASLNRMSSRNGLRMRRWHSSISTSVICAAIGESRSTSAIRTVCELIPANCMMFLTSMGSRTGSKFMPALTQVR